MINRRLPLACLALALPSLSPDDGNLHDKSIMYSDDILTARIEPSAQTHPRDTIKEFRETCNGLVPLSIMLILQRSEDPIGDLEKLKTVLSEMKDRKFQSLLKELDKALDVLYQYPVKQSGLRNSIDISEIQEWAKRAINALQTQNEIYAPNAPTANGSAQDAYIYLTGGSSTHIMGEKATTAREIIKQILDLSKDKDIKYPELILELAIILGDVKEADRKAVLEELQKLTLATKNEAIFSWLRSFVDIKRLFFGSKDNIGMMQLAFTMGGFVFFLASVVALDAKLSLISIAPITYGLMLSVIFAFLSTYLSPDKRERTQHFNQLVVGYFVLYFLLYTGFVFNIELLSTLGRSIGFFRNDFLVNWTKAMTHFFNPVKKMLMSPAANTFARDAASMGA